MTGDTPKLENPPFVQAAPQGHLEFGVDLSQRPQILRTHANGENVFRVRDAQSPTTLRNEGPFSAITMPPGWSEFHPPSTPGVNVFRVADGKTFVPQEHADPRYGLHEGPGAAMQVTPQDQAAFRQLLAYKPATNGPQPLTQQEFQAVAGAIRGFSSGNDHVPVYITEAATVNVNGRTGLLVKGAGSGAMHEAIYFDNSPAQGESSIAQLSMTAPLAEAQQYQRAFLFAANSIHWTEG